MFPTPFYACDLVLRVKSSDGVNTRGGADGENGSPYQNDISAFQGVSWPGNAGWDVMADKPSQA